MILMKKYLKKILYKNEYSSIVPINDNFKKRKISEIIGGKLNPDKVFYIIRRYPGTGLLSNLAYVINHIQIANRMGFIPIVDMKNYPSVYNENDKIFGTLNSWEYYFEQLTDYSLDEVYQSKNIIITDNKEYEAISLFTVCLLFINIKVINVKILNLSHVSLEKFGIVW